MFVRYAYLILLFGLSGCAAKDASKLWFSSNAPAEQINRDFVECKGTVKELTEPKFRNKHPDNRLLEDPNNFRKHKELSDKGVSLCMKEKGYSEKQ